MLREALADLIRQETEGKFTYEILVIDDGSTDQTKYVVEKVASLSCIPVRYVQGESKGYTHALNKGLAESRSEWLAFFDDDQLVDANWLKELFAVAIDEGVHVVGGSTVLVMSEAELSMLGPVCRGYCAEHPIYRRWQRRQSTPLPPGNNRIVKRTVFDSIGVFDERMLSGGCDRDLILRAKAAGFNFGWAPKALVQHVIASYRVKPDHITWYSQQVGCSFAYIDWKRWGRGKTLLACIARIGQALLVNFPMLLLGYTRRSRAEVLDRKALLMAALGYTRKTLSLLTPHAFAQESYFARMEFRKEREIFSKDFTFAERNQQNK